jgi:ABC-type transport system involved in cytochrome c biogenesis permease subunit
MHDGAGQIGRHRGADGAGAAAAWWALTGLIVTTFAFLGVNMFLSGLHSYGKL